MSFVSIGAHWCPKEAAAHHDWNFASKILLGTPSGALVALSAMHGLDQDLDLLLCRASISFCSCSCSCSSSSEVPGKPIVLNFESPHV